MDLTNLLPFANKDAARLAAINKARGLFTGAQRVYGLTGAGMGGGAKFNFNQIGTGGGVFREAPGTGIPNLTGIPGAANFNNPNVNVGGINSSILAIQKQFNVKVGGSESLNSEGNLKAIFDSANKPLTKAEAAAQSYAFFDNIIKQYMKDWTNPENYDAQVQADLEADIAKAKEGQAEA